MINMIAAIVLTLGQSPAPTGPPSPAPRLYLVTLHADRPPGPSAVLSPALVAARDSGGTLVSVDDDGRAIVVATPGGGLAKLRACPAVKEVEGLEGDGDRRLPRFFRVTRLKLSYRPGRPPTEAEVAGLGVKLIEDYRPGSFVVVEPVGTGRAIIAGDLAGRIERAGWVRRATVVAPAKAIQGGRP